MDASQTDLAIYNASSMDMTGEDSGDQGEKTYILATTAIDNEQLYGEAEVNGCTCTEACGCNLSCEAVIQVNKETLLRGHLGGTSLEQDDYLDWATFIELHGDDEDSFSVDSSDFAHLCSDQGAEKDVEKPQKAAVDYNQQSQSGDMLNTSEDFVYINHASAENVEGLDGSEISIESEAEEISVEFCNPEISPVIGQAVDEARTTKHGTASEFHQNSKCHHHLDSDTEIGTVPYGHQNFTDQAYQQDSPGPMPVTGSDFVDNNLRVTAAPNCVLSAYLGDESLNNSDQGQNDVKTDLRTSARYSVAQFIYTTDKVTDTLSKIADTTNKISASVGKIADTTEIKPVEIYVSNDISETGILDKPVDIVDVTDIASHKLDEFLDTTDIVADTLSEIADTTNKISDSVGEIADTTEIKPVEIYESYDISETGILDKPVDIVDVTDIASHKLDEFLDTTDIVTDTLSEIADTTNKISGSVGEIADTMEIKPVEIYESNDISETGILDKPVDIVDVTDIASHKLDEFLDTTDIVADTLSEIADTTNKISDSVGEIADTTEIKPVEIYESYDISETGILDKPVDIVDVTDIASHKLDEFLDTTDIVTDTLSEIADTPNKISDSVGEIADTTEIKSVEIYESNDMSETGILDKPVDIVDVTDIASHKLDELLDTTDIVTDTLSQIADTTNQISDSVGELADITEIKPSEKLKSDIKSDTEIYDKSVEVVSAASQNLDVFMDTTHRVTSTLSEIADTAHKISDYLEDIADISDKSSQKYDESDGTSDTADTADIMSARLVEFVDSEYTHTTDRSPEVPFDGDAAPSSRNKSAETGKASEKGSENNRNISASPHPSGQTDFRPFTTLEGDNCPQTWGQPHGQNEALKAVSNSVSDGSTAVLDADILHPITTAQEPLYRDEIHYVPFPVDSTSNKFDKSHNQKMHQEGAHCPDVVIEKLAPSVTDIHFSQEDEMGCFVEFIGEAVCDSMDPDVLDTSSEAGQALQSGTLSEPVRNKCDSSVALQAKPANTIASVINDFEGDVKLKVMKPSENKPGDYDGPISEYSLEEVKDQIQSAVSLYDRKHTDLADTESQLNDSDIIRHAVDRLPLCGPVTAQGASVQLVSAHTLTAAHAREQGSSPAVIATSDQIHQGQSYPTDAAQSLPHLTSGAVQIQSEYRGTAEKTPGRECEDVTIGKDVGDNRHDGITEHVTTATGETDTDAFTSLSSIDNMGNDISKEKRGLSRHPNVSRSVSADPETLTGGSVREQDEAGRGALTTGQRSCDSEGHLGDTQYSVPHWTKNDPKSETTRADGGHVASTKKDVHTAEVKQLEGSAQRLSPALTVCHGSGTDGICMAGASLPELNTTEQDKKFREDSDIIQDIKPQSCDILGMSGVAADITLGGSDKTVKPLERASDAPVEDEPTSQPDPTQKHAAHRPAEGSAGRSTIDTPGHANENVLIYQEDKMNMSTDTPPEKEIIVGTAGPEKQSIQEQLAQAISDEETQLTFDDDDFAILDDEDDDKYVETGDKYLDKKCLTGQTDSADQAVAEADQDNNLLMDSTSEPQFVTVSKSDKLQDEPVIKVDNSTSNKAECIQYEKMRESTSPDEITYTGNPGLKTSETSTLQELQSKGGNCVDMSDKDVLTETASRSEAETKSRLAIQNYAVEVVTVEPPGLLTDLNGTTETCVVGDQQQLVCVTDGQTHNIVTNMLTPLVRGTVAEHPGGEGAAPQECRACVLDNDTSQEKVSELLTSQSASLSAPLSTTHSHIGHTRMIQSVAMVTDGEDELTCHVTDSVMIREDTRQPHIKATQVGRDTHDIVPPVHVALALASDIKEPLILKSLESEKQKTSPENSDKIQSVKPDRPLEEPASSDKQANVPSYSKSSVQQKPTCDNCDLLNVGFEFNESTNVHQSALLPHGSQAPDVAACSSSEVKCQAIENITGVSEGFLGLKMATTPIHHSGFLDSGLVEEGITSFIEPTTPVTDSPMTFSGTGMTEGTLHGQALPHGDTPCITDNTPYVQVQGEQALRHVGPDNSHLTGTQLPNILEEQDEASSDYDNISDFPECHEPLTDMKTITENIPELEDIDEHAEAEDIITDNGNTLDTETVSDQTLIVDEPSLVQTCGEVTEGEPDVVCGVAIPVMSPDQVQSYSVATTSAVTDPQSETINLSSPENMITLPDCGVMSQIVDAHHTQSIDTDHSWSLAAANEDTGVQPVITQQVTRESDKPDLDVPVKQDETGKCPALPLLDPDSTQFVLDRKNMDDDNQSQAQHSAIDNDETMTDSVLLQDGIPTGSQSGQVDLSNIQLKTSNGDQTDLICSKERPVYMATDIVQGITAAAIEEKTDSQPEIALVISGQSELTATPTTASPSDAQSKTVLVKERTASLGQRAAAPVTSVVSHTGPGPAEGVGSISEHFISNDSSQAPPAADKASKIKQKNTHVSCSSLEAKLSGDATGQEGSANSMNSQQEGQHTRKSQAQLSGQEKSDAEILCEEAISDVPLADSSELLDTTMEETNIQNTENREPGTSQNIDTEAMQATLPESNSDSESAEKCTPEEGEIFTEKPCDGSDDPPHRGRSRKPGRHDDSQFKGARQRSQSLPGLFTDEDVEDAVNKLKASQNNWPGPCKGQDKKYQGQPYREYIWDSIHFYPDIHLIDNSELLQRRRYYELSLQQLRNQEAAGRMATIVETPIQPTQTHPDHYPSSGIPQADTDSDSDSPKRWHKNPLCVKKTKKSGGRAASDVRLSAVGASSPDGSDVEASPKGSRRKKGSSSKQNGKLPSRAELQDMFEKFEELQRRRRAVDTSSDESVGQVEQIGEAPELPSRNYLGSETSPYQHEPSNFDFKENPVYAQQSEIVQALDSNTCKGVKPPTNSASTPARRPTELGVTPHGVTGPLKQHVISERPRHDQPAQKDQYDMKHLALSQDGVRDVVPGMAHYDHYVQGRNNAPVRRISSFENLYNTVDLSPEQSAMHRVDYEPRQKIPEQEGTVSTDQERISVDDTIQGLQDVAQQASVDPTPVSSHVYSEVTHELPSTDRTEPDRQKEQFSGGDSINNLSPEETISKAMADLQSSARRKEWGAKELLKEEQEKYVEYKREYNRRFSEKSENEPHSPYGDIMFADGQRKSDTDSGGHDPHPVIPPDEYEYILRRVVHRRQDAVIQENYGRKFQLAFCPTKSTENLPAAIVESSSVSTPVPAGAKDVDEISVSSTEPAKLSAKADRLNLRAYLQGDIPAKKSAEKPIEHAELDLTAAGEAGVKTESLKPDKSSKDKNQNLDYNSGIFITAVLEPKEDPKPPGSPRTPAELPPQPERENMSWHWPIRASADNLKQFQWESDSSAQEETVNQDQNSWKTRSEPRLALKPHSPMDQPDQWDLAHRKSSHSRPGHHLVEPEYASVSKQPRAPPGLERTHKSPNSLGFGLSSVPLEQRPELTADKQRQPYSYVPDATVGHNTYPRGVGELGSPSQKTSHGYKQPVHAHQLSLQAPHHQPKTGPHFDEQPSTGSRMQHQYTPRDAGLSSRDQQDVGPLRKGQTRHYDPRRAPYVESNQPAHHDSYERIPPGGKERHQDPIFVKVQRRLPKDRSSSAKYRSSRPRSQPDRGWYDHQDPFTDRSWQQQSGPPSQQTFRLDGPKQWTNTSTGPALASSDRVWPHKEEDRSTDWDRHIPRAHRPRQRGQKLPLQRSGSEPDIACNYQSKKKIDQQWSQQLAGAPGRSDNKRSQRSERFMLHEPSLQEYNHMNFPASQQMQAQHLKKASRPVSMPEDPRICAQAHRPQEDPAGVHSKRPGELSVYGGSNHRDHTIGQIRESSPPKSHSDQHASSQQYTPSPMNSYKRERAISPDHYKQDRPGHIGPELLPAYAYPDLYFRQAWQPGRQAQPAMPTPKQYQSTEMLDRTGNRPSHREYSTDGFGIPNPVQYHPSHGYHPDEYIPSQLHPGSVHSVDRVMQRVSKQQPGYTSVTAQHPHPDYSASSHHRTQEKPPSRSHYSSDSQLLTGDLSPRYYQSQKSPTHTQPQQSFSSVNIPVEHQVTPPPQRSSRSRHPILGDLDLDGSNVPQQYPNYNIYYHNRQYTERRGVPHHRSVPALHMTDTEYREEQLPGHGPATADASTGPPATSQPPVPTRTAASQPKYTDLSRKDAGWNPNVHQQPASKRTLQNYRPPVYMDSGQLGSNRFSQHSTNTGSPARHSEGHQIDPKVGPGISGMATGTHDHVNRQDRTRPPPVSEYAFKPVEQGQQNIGSQTAAITTGRNFQGSPRQVTLEQRASPSRQRNSQAQHMAHRKSPAQQTMGSGSPSTDSSAGRAVRYQSPGGCPGLPRDSPHKEEKHLSPATLTGSPAQPGTARANQVRSPLSPFYDNIPDMCQPQQYDVQLMESRDGAKLRLQHPATPPGSVSVRHGKQMSLQKPAYNEGKKQKPSEVWRNIMYGELNAKDSTSSQPLPLGQVLCKSVPKVTGDTEKEDQLKRQSSSEIKVIIGDRPKSADASYYIPSAAEKDFVESSGQRAKVFQEMKTHFERRAKEEDPKPVQHRNFGVWKPVEKKTFRMEPDPKAKLEPVLHARPVMMYSDPPKEPVMYNTRDVTDSREDEDDRIDIRAIKENLFGPEGEKPARPQSFGSVIPTGKNSKSPWTSQKSDEYLLDYASFRDSGGRRRPNIQDHLTELEEIYDGLALQDEDLHMRYANSAFRPVFKDRTNRLQGDLDSPSMEYTKQWLISDGGKRTSLDGQDGEGRRYEEPLQNVARLDVSSRSQVVAPSPTLSSNSSVHGRKILLPRKIGDDMAFRKHMRKSAVPPQSGDPASQISYLPVSSSSDQAASVDSLPGTSDHVTDKGISTSTTKPTSSGLPSQTTADYMVPRTTEPQRSRARTKPEISPDKYHDDFAYRNLRRDAPEVKVHIPNYDKYRLTTRSRSLERSQAAHGRSHEARSSSLDRDPAKAAPEAIVVKTRMSLAKGVQQMVNRFSGEGEAAARDEASDVEQTPFSERYISSVSISQPEVKPESPTTKVSIKVLPKQTLRGIKHKQEQKAKLKTVTAGEPDEAALSEMDSDTLSGGTDCRRSSPDGAFQSDDLCPKSSHSPASTRTSADSDPGLKSQEGHHGQVSEPDKPKPCSVVDTVNPVSVTSKVKTEDPHARRVITVQTHSSSVSTHTQLSTHVQQIVTDYTPDKRTENSSSPFKPIEPDTSAETAIAKPDYGPRSMETQNFTDETSQAASSPASNSKGGTTTKVSFLTLQKSVVKPKAMITSTPGSTQNTEQVHKTTVHTATRLQKSPAHRKHPLLSTETADTTDDNMSIGDLLDNQPDEEVSDVESLAVLVSKQGLMSPIDDIFLSDYENSRATPTNQPQAVKSSASPGHDVLSASPGYDVLSEYEDSRATPTNEPEDTRKPPAAPRTGTEPDPAPGKTSPQKESRLHIDRQEHGIRRRTVEVMLKPEPEVKRRERVGSPTEERPKSFHELVASFEAQTSPFYRGRGQGLRKIRKFSSHESIPLSPEK